jgi:hypothetical protein
MNKLIKKYKQPKLSQDEMQNLSTFIKSEENSMGEEKE